MLPRIQQAIPLPGHRLKLKFNNQEERIFDCTAYLDIGVFKKLNAESYFNQVKASDGTACWPEGQDFCPDMLYLESKPL